ncbi:hypothetical protein R4M03_01185 [Brachyspira pilosicoli]|uniref:Uncharacterized protein n=3 Tax=Brachyspira pilosicoli TaxID=52584 RepID=D8IDX3_BRAP9|nr:hypothetical protein [Brachyspira pilosicoli]ADK31346.1 hypothetical protein BP951000_1359 [Brachyspira pilosicoli 95/1000]AFR71918.1 hypothetical protein B2904_orf2597 [Brachyspira pilosicoli B2904]MBW5378190.1 hypothetical protein [Brachyspira pilosicoli]MBW5399566.1 hypothetical protein [Brachyspira pilosicoli]PLV64617.1 hypothetical protein BPSP16_00615 [Brachyspira pilosicoli SP16]
MQYIFIIAVIFIVIAVLFFITNSRVISYDKDWIKAVKRKVVNADKKYVFEENGDIIIDNKKKLTLIKAKNNKMAVYSNSDFINKFMLVFSAYTSVKVTFMEGYIIDNNKLYYTYAYKSSYYKKLNDWMNNNGVFESKEVWVANKKVNWKTFPSPRENDINWEKKVLIGDIVKI